jgi:hypothetical protein
MARTIVVAALLLVSALGEPLGAQARNPLTGECRQFPTPCDVPAGWERVTACP